MAQSRFPVTRFPNAFPSLFEGWPDFMNRFMFPSFFERTLSMGALAPVDVCERDNEYIVRMACAGCRPEDIDVTVENDVVRIRGKFSDHTGAQGAAQAQGQGTPQFQGQGNPQFQGQGNPQFQGQPGQGQTAPNETCLIRELPTGRFERDITLPSAVNAQQAHAHFHHGMLTLMLPKTQVPQGHKIQVSHGHLVGAGNQ